MATDTARHATAGAAGAPAAMNSVLGAVGAAGGVVVLRDELGILSVMRCLDAQLALDPGFQHGFPADSAAMAGLSDPRLAPPLSYVVDAGGQIVATVCRHVTGVRLSKVLGQLPRGLDVQTASAVVKDVLSALEALHGRGVAHRSPDADHVIIEPNGGCVLVDVGLAPRPAEDDLAAAMAADLAAVTELFVTCLSTGRRLPERTSRPSYFAQGELEGVAARLYDALAGTGAEFGLEPEAERGHAAVPGTPPIPRPRTAASMYQALDAVAADTFDAGWDGRGRERLAAAAKEHRSARRRFLEFRPSGHTDHRWSIRDWRAAPHVRHAASGHGARRGLTSLGRLDWTHLGGTKLIRYLVPAIAFLLAFGLALILLGLFSDPAPASGTMRPVTHSQSQSQSQSQWQWQSASASHHSSLNSAPIR